MTTYNDFPFYDGPFNPAHGLINNQGGRHGVQHTCSPVDRDTCLATDAIGWRDHCHAYNWLLDALNGDRDAEGHLVAYYTHPMRVNFRHRTLSKMNTLLDEDEKTLYIQEAILHIIRKYDPAKGEWGAFLRGKMHNQLVDLFRRDFKDHRKVFEFDKMLADERANNPDLTDQQLADRLVGQKSQYGTLSQNQVDDRLAYSRALNGGVVSIDHDDNPDRTAQMAVAPASTQPEHIYEEREERLARRVILEGLRQAAGLTEDDLDLLLAYADKSLDHYADTHGIAHRSAITRATALMRKIQNAANGVTASLLDDGAEASVVAETVMLAHTEGNQPSLFA